MTHNEPEKHAKRLAMTDNDPQLATMNHNEPEKHAGIHACMREIRGNSLTRWRFFWRDYGIRDFFEGIERRVQDVKN